MQISLIFVFAKPSTQVAGPEDLLMLGQTAIFSNRSRYFG